MKYIKQFFVGLIISIFNLYFILGIVCLIIAKDKISIIMSMIWIILFLPLNFVTNYLTGKKL